MKKIYPVTLLLILISTISETISAADYYFNVPGSQTFQEVTASQYANCNTSANTCTFFLGSDGANIHPDATLTFTNNESCMNCTFYSFYNKTDQVIISSNVTFQNVKFIGSYLLITDGASLTLADDISLYTHNQEPNKMISYIVIGDSSAPSRQTTIDLNGHNINMYSPLPPVPNTVSSLSVIILTDANSSVMDNSAKSDGQINYYYSPIPVNDSYTYLFNQNLFSANGGVGNNPGTNPIPYTALANGHFKLVGPSISQIVVSGASSNPLSAMFVPTVPTPVILTDFEADMQIDGTVHLSWTTDGELNADHFDILRSANGSEWATLSSVQANGNTSAMMAYSSNDEHPELGSNSYRLRIVDNQGNFTYSAIKVITNSSVQALTVFPNPAKDMINIYSGAAINSDLTMRIININGQVLQTRKIAAGSSIVSIPVNSYPAGVYALQFNEPSGSSKTIKVLISR